MHGRRCYDIRKNTTSLFRYKEPDIAVRQIEAVTRAQLHRDAGGELEVLSPGQPVRSFELDSPLVTNGELYQVRLPFAVEPLDLLCARV